MVQYLPHVMLSIACITHSKATSEREVSLCLESIVVFKQIK